MDRRPASNLVTIASVAVVAYAAADIVHEAGHAIVATLHGIQVLSISSVAIQSARSSRIVAAAGTIADIVAGLLAFALLARTTRFDARRYFLWLFGFVSLMNSWYLVFSGLINSGDWSVVVAGWNPAWAWRLGLVIAGLLLYATAIRLAARVATRWVSSGEISVAELRYVTVWSYVTGGILLVAASALNPIGLQLVLVSGVGASFGLTWGLLLVPGIAAPGAGDRPAAALPPLALQYSWAVAALVVGGAFVLLLGPGIQLSW